MKLKQVTFAEALECMKAGGFAHSDVQMKYRVSENRLQAFTFDRWLTTSNDLSDALKPWFIEVEPMKHARVASVKDDGFLEAIYMGDEWKSKRVRVTVEEI